MTPMNRLSTAIKGGLAYVIIVFAVGFLLGAIRVMVVAPLIGEFSGVCLEAPIMLAVSWVACGWSLRAFGVGERTTSRLAMGGAAFALLIGAETAVGAVLFARAPLGVIQSFGTPAGAVGLASQIGFALIPLFRARAPIS
jgi:hypothetical protein